VDLDNPHPTLTFEIFFKRDLLFDDVNYFGTMIMRLGLADGMVSGAMHSSGKEKQELFVFLR
jgi:Phosphate acetyl/butaryl transferase